MIQRLFPPARVGSAEGLLLRAVQFLVLGDTGWAEGILVAWSDLQQPPGSPSPNTEVVPDEAQTPWPLRFVKSEQSHFERVMVMQMWKGHVARTEPVESVRWLRLLGSKSVVSSC